MSGNGEGSGAADSRRRARSAWSPVVCLVLFVALTGMVVSAVARPLDEGIIRQVRPGDAWGEAQVRYSPWMHMLAPPRMMVLLALVALLESARRRSSWPAVYAAALTTAAVLALLVVKFAVGRPDPHGYVTATGGSYPSGHVAVLVVCLSGCLLLLRPTPHWWMWTPIAGATGLMTVSLVVSAAHWPSDVLGGVLLALGVVTGVTTVGSGRQAGTRGRDHQAMPGRWPRLSPRRASGTCVLVRHGSTGSADDPC